MACNNCNETQDPNCGCTTEALHINQICNPIVCPSDECAESFSAACIRYTGDDLVCDRVTVVEADTNISQALSNIVAFICADTAGTTTVVAAGNNIVVTSNTVGNTTTYTVATQCPMTVLIGNTNLVPRSIQATVTGGTAPYTYVWEMADFTGDTGSLQSMILLDATAFPQVVRPALNPSYIGNFFDSNGIPNSARTGLAKVTVTDANGCIARDTLFIVFTPGL